MLRELLTPREAQVLSLRERGLSIKEISSELGVSISAVKWHLSHVLQKTRTLSSLAAIYKMRAMQGDRWRRTPCTKGQVV